ncbi:hypothetical protein CV014_22890 [Nostoc sp. CMAA1605]|nr:hypothetical protein [Nostoc sp. CMAA1605]
MTNTYTINQNLLLESSSDDSYEENDTLATAYDLTASAGVLLSSIEGAGISYAGDEDWYKVTIDASAPYFSAFVTFPINSRYIDLEVYKPDGTFVSSAAYRFGNIDNYRREIKTILAPGDYYLKINSPFSDPNTNQISNTYDLLWETQTISSITDEFEDNDTLETATNISSQARNYFTDLLLTDEDWYQIAVNPGEERLRITYEIGNSENPVTLNIYDAAGNLINSLESLQNSPYVQEFNTTLPSDGTYYLQWVPSETGNTYAFIWETLGLSNLTISNASVSNSNPELGDTISVSWTVENNGNYDTLEGWYDAVYLSEDTTLDGETDVFLTNNYYLYNLIPGSNYTQTIDLTIPNYLGLGSRYLLFVTDNYNDESEDNETDNVYSVPIVLGGDAPNLVITNVTPIPTTAAVGQSIDLSWTVTNNGTATTGISYWFDRVVFSRNQVFGDSDDIYLNEQYIYSQYGLPLDVNETYTVNSTFILPTEAAGSGYLLYKTDNYNYQGETDETDNVYVQAINVAAPNLTITNVTAPTTAVAGQSINLTWTVKNDGSVTTGSSYWYDLVLFSKNQIFGDSDDIYLIDEYVSTADGLPLEANETYTINKTFNLSGEAIGTGYLLFKADGYEYQSETNENDNVYVHAIDIAAPNLVVTNFTSPITAVAGQSINVSWTVRNDGSITTGSTYWFDRLVFSKNQIFGDGDDIYITEPYIYSAYGLPLEANETYTVNQTINLPGKPIGSGYLLLKTDNYNYQGETNENDNVSVRAIDIAAPNLTISNATAPSAAILGESVSVTWTILNNGSVPANADWYDSVYVSNDQVLDIGDQRIDSFYQSARSPLASGTSYTDTRNIIIPNNVALGDRYLIFVADYYDYFNNNYQGETNETDNTYVVPINLSAPDLIVSQANAPSTGVVNGAIDVSWTVRNQGTVAAPADWFDYIYLSTDATYSFNDTFITSQSISTQTPLAADGSYTINRSITLPNVTAGNYYLIFRADGSGNQGETNNSNNDRAIQITIGTPDLIVSQANVPQSGVLGSTVSVSWTVTNQGNVAAPADWSDYIYWSSNDTYDFSDTLITTISAASQTPVAAGGSYTQTQTITLPNQLGFVGNGYLIFRANGNNIQGETNNNNNDRAVAFRVNAPDLIVSNASAPESVTVGATLSITWDVTNQGTVAANADWWDRIVISTDQIFGNGDDTYLTEVWAGASTPLAAGATYTRTTNVTLPTTATGDRYLLFRADNYNNQGETDENNNVRAVAINISAADLQVTSTNAPTAAVLGETVELTWTVTNQGTGTATRDWFDRVYLSSNETLDGSDVQVTSEYISTQTPLAVGASYTISKNVALPNFTPGNQFLLFVADRDNYQGETNENNNVRVVGINLSAPDLIVSNASAPTTGTLGKSIEVSWTVQNQGTTSASADWYDYIYLSNDQVFDANSDTYVTQELISTQTPLAANGSYTITRNINLPNVATGNRYLIFVADGSQQQGETNNTNNTRTVAISLNAPDLVVSNIIAPVESLSGQSIDITWTVTNQGAATAEGTWWDRLYLVNSSNGAFIRDLGYFSFTGSIAAGASLERSQSLNLPLALTGDYKVVVTTDNYGNIPEGTQNESNTTTDEQTLQIRLSPVPNLQVSSVTAPATAFSSQDTVVQWTVTNVDTGATNAPIWYDRVYLSLDQTFDDTDTYLGQTTNPSYLNVGDSYTNSLTVTLPRGIDSNYYFLVQTDAYNSVTEVGNEGDNFRAGGPTDVNLTPPPDLQVTTVNAPSGAFSGQPVTLSWTVTNEGTGRTLENTWYDRIFMSLDETLDASDRFLGEVLHNGSLNADSSYNASATVNLPIGVSGNYYFFVRTDHYNQVYENAFEGNNAGYDAIATNITLTPPPDLEVESIILPNNARAGGNLIINYRVTNFGATETPANTSFWTDTFYLSLDNQLNTTTDIRLGSIDHYGILEPDQGYNGTANFTLSNTLTGNYYVFVTTDSGDQVFELNNNNNTLSSNNQVQIVSRPSDLVVTSTTAPTTTEAGKTLRLQWTVKTKASAIASSPLGQIEYWYQLTLS